MSEVVDPDAEERMMLVADRAVWYVVGFIYQATALVGVGLSGLGFAIGPWPLAIPGAVCVLASALMGWRAYRSCDTTHRELMARRGVRR